MSILKHALNYLLTHADSRMLIPRREWEKEPTMDPQAHRVGSRNAHRWCHMWTVPESLPWLHWVAQKIGMKREWFQDRRGFPHYDLTPGRRAEAVKRCKVRETSLREWMQANRPPKLIPEIPQPDFMLVDSAGLRRSQDH